MQTRILDLDGSVRQQATLRRRTQALVLPLNDWGPRLRLACSHRSFAQFERRLSLLNGTSRDVERFVNFLGSGDFHHVSLALLRRLSIPFNLLVIDNHPDWMRGIPLLHCGTWLWHAAQLPGLQRIYHLGGEVDFDNAYRWLAPWPLLRSGKLVVGPARRQFRGRWWNEIHHHPLRRSPDRPAERGDIENWLAPHRVDLAAWPLYISLDKDVLSARDAVVNWDSGYLSVPEVLDVLDAFVNAANEDVLGMDVVGDWSPIRVGGWMRRFLDWSEHPALTVEPQEAAEHNEALNLRLIESFASERFHAPQLTPSI
jgi:arginase family enzyme